MRPRPATTDSLFTSAPPAAPACVGASVDAVTTVPTLGPIVGSEKEVQALYLATKDHPAGVALALRAAHQLAGAKKKAADKGYVTWLKNVVVAWELFDTKGERAPDGASMARQRPFVDYAAEAAFTLVDDDIRQKWGVRSTPKVYAGAIDDIRGKLDPKTRAVVTPGTYTKDAQDADAFDKVLGQISGKYPSALWRVTTLARQGSLYEDLRAGLDATPLPPAGYFTPQQTVFLTALQSSGDTAQLEELRAKAAEGWRLWRAQTLLDAEGAMVTRYAAAVFLARKYDVKTVAAASATSGLAHFSEVLGEAKIREYVSATPNPEDTSLKLEYQDGMYK